MRPYQPRRQVASGRAARLLAEERQRSLGWFYLSFATDDGFLGAIIVWAHGLLTAVERAADLGLDVVLDPGGEVVCCPIPRQHLRRVPADLRNRVLSEAEVRQRLAGKRIDE
jgi:hypothetical protein